MPSLIVQPKLLTETRTDIIDATPWLAAGQTVASATGTAAVYSGVDASPAALLSSVGNTTTTVSPKFTAGVVGTIYQVRLDLILAAPVNTLSLAFFLAVIPDLP